MLRSSTKIITRSALPALSVRRGNVKEPSQFFLFFPIFSLFFPFFPDFLPLFPNFRQIFHCAPWAHCKFFTGHSAPLTSSGYATDHSLTSRGTWFKETQKFTFIIISNIGLSHLKSLPPLWKILEKHSTGGVCIWSGLSQQILLHEIHSRTFSLVLCNT